MSKPNASSAPKKKFPTVLTVPLGIIAIGFLVGFLFAFIEVLDSSDSPVPPSQSQPDS